MQNERNGYDFKQIIQTDDIDELKTITKVDIYVFDLDGIKVAATTEILRFPVKLLRDLPHLRQIARWSADITF